MNHCSLSFDYLVTVVLILLQGPGTDPRAIDIIRRGVLEGRLVLLRMSFFDRETALALVFDANSVHFVMFFAHSHIASIFPFFADSFC